MSHDQYKQHNQRDQHDQDKSLLNKYITVGGKIRRFKNGPLNKGDLVLFHYAPRIIVKAIIVEVTSKYKVKICPCHAINIWLNPKIVINVYRNRLELINRTLIKDKTST